MQYIVSDLYCLSNEILLWYWIRVFSERRHRIEHHTLPLEKHSEWASQLRRPKSGEQTETNARYLARGKSVWVGRTSSAHTNAGSLSLKLAKATHSFFFQGYAGRGTEQIRGPRGEQCSRGGTIEEDTPRTMIDYEAH